MAIAKISIETEFLREFVRTYVSEIALTAKALDDLLRVGVGLADVNYVLKKGRVIMSEKEEPDGAKWIVEGDTCDGENLNISLHVWCDRYQVRVLRVLKI